MQSYTMTQAQTAAYDSPNDAARAAMWREITEAIQADPETYGEYVEVYTSDGIVADIIDLR